LLCKFDLWAKEEGLFKFKAANEVDAERERERERESFIRNNGGSRAAEEEKRGLRERPVKKK